MEAYVIMGMVGPWQIVLLILVIVLLFGGRKIPELMRGIGQGMKEFKNATKDGDSKDEEKTDKKLEKGDA
jgi:sec-independent protein translocase protein TatA